MTTCTARNEIYVTWKHIMPRHTLEKLSLVAWEVVISSLDAVVWPRKPTIMREPASLQRGADIMHITGAVHSITRL